MSQKISYTEFERVYKESLDFIFKNWTPDLQEEMARHCKSWSPNYFDFRAYLSTSCIRFYKAYEVMTTANAPHVCDIGGFTGAFGLTLLKLGIPFSMTETLRYYSRAFLDFFSKLEASGLNIVDYDPFEEGASLPKKFNFVTALAILEHYPHSLKNFMTNMANLTEPNGRLYLEVPNIAYWPNRLKLLKGQSPLPPIGIIYDSETPFIGHHHEFTMNELNELIARGSFSLEANFAFNYSTPKISLKEFLRHPISSVSERAIPKMFGSMRECLVAVGRKT